MFFMLSLSGFAFSKMGQGVFIQLFRASGWKKIFSQVILTCPQLATSVLKMDFGQSLADPINQVLMHLRFVFLPITHSALLDGNVPPN